MGQEASAKENVDLKFVDEVIKRWESDPAYLIPMMQDIQARYSYLPRPALLLLQEKLKLPLARVSEVATFYKAMSLKPKGRHQLHVCLGTACHLKGGPRIVDTFKRELEVEVDETTKDGEFTLQTVNCVGACALAPVVVVDGNVTGRMDASKVKQMLARLSPGKAEAAEAAKPGKPEKKAELAKPAAKAGAASSKKASRPARAGKGQKKTKAKIASRRK